MSAAYQASCTRCEAQPARSRREHAERVLCEKCAARPPLVRLDVSGPITPCPGCGMKSSENYMRRGLCWDCYLELEAQLEADCRGNERAIAKRLTGMRGHE